MLGLGNLIIKSDTMRRVAYEYKSSFESSTDNWTASSSNADPEFTLEHGENPPGESTNDWLKVTLGGETDEAYAAFKLTLNTGGTGDWLPAEISRKKNDLITIEFKVQLVGSYWQNSFGVAQDPVGGLRNIVYNKATGYPTTIPLSTTTIVKTSHAMNIPNWGQELSILRSNLFTNTNTPVAGAVYYIKDVCARVWRY